MGPVISKASQDRCTAMIAQAKSDGAIQVSGGSWPDLPAPFDQGFFIRPTVFNDVQPDQELFREETFGPLISVTPFATEEEAVALADTDTFGHGVSIWSRDIARAHHLSRGIRGGVFG